MLKDEPELWTTADAAKLYGLCNWGNGYFSIGDSGNVRVHATKDANVSIELKDLVERLSLRGMDLPILIRFNDILRDRLEDIYETFQQAIYDHDYDGQYTCVYPIKVNQQRQIVEAILNYGKHYGFGLEAGSKPELLAVLALTDAETPVICNGFKDAEFIEMVMLAQKIGRRVIPVVERLAELELILHYAQKVDVHPQLGIRVKLAARGAGRWRASAGYRAKFGLSVNELLAAWQRLSDQQMQHCFTLLHFHLGSQITNIRPVKAALIEASRVYADLVKQGALLKFLDVGGGLGVDYDGSQTNFESSTNYTLAEYANDVIYHVQNVCDEAGVPHPNIITESGRAVAAYHSVLVFDVLGVSRRQLHEPSAEVQKSDGVEQPIRDLFVARDELCVQNVQETFHDAQQAMDMAISMFGTGNLPLDQRCLAEALYWTVCFRIRELVNELEYVPDELEQLDALLADTYFCNFSIFQSLPDSWAIKQLFPIMPIHHLDQHPKRHAVLGDVTCDSDGKIDRFIDRRDDRCTLLLHEYDGSPYYLAAFLVGAYQEILGDLHNLFGDTNAAHVSLTADGQITLDTMVKGDTVSEVLEYVQFDSKELLRKLQSAIEKAVRENLIDQRQAGKFIKYYEQSLQGYTYLEDATESD